MCRQREKWNQRKEWSKLLSKRCFCEPFQQRYRKPRWLVLNKLDMVPTRERAALVKDFVKRFKFKGPVFEISALNHEGCEALVKAAYQHIKAQQVVEHPLERADPRFPSGVTP